MNAWELLSLVVLLAVLVAFWYVAARRARLDKLTALPREFTGSEPDDRDDEKGP